MQRWEERRAGAHVGADPSCWASDNKWDAGRGLGSGTGTEERTHTCSREISLSLSLSLTHTHTHTHTDRTSPPKLTQPPTQSPTGGSALFAEKACSVSVISTHCSGVRVKPGTYRDKGLVAPPRQRPVSPGRGIHGEEQAQD